MAQDLLPFAGAGAGFFQAGAAVYFRL